MGVLALLAGTVAGQLAAGFLARRGHADVGNLAFVLLLVALLAARTGYVASAWSAYAAHPADMLNVRDGGFIAWVGLLALIVIAGGLAAVRRRLRVPLSVTVLAGIATWGLVLLAGRQLDATAQPPLPQIALHALDGQTQSVEAWRGRPLVINFWATWCPPCRREMPVLAEAQRRYPEVRFVFADQGESPAQVRRFLERQNLHLENVFLDDGALGRYYRVRGFPTTVFIGADGRMADIHVGELSRASLEHSLRRIAPQASRP